MISATIPWALYPSGVDSQNESLVGVPTKGSLKKRRRLYLLLAMRGPIQAWEIIDEARGWVNPSKELKKLYSDAGFGNCAWYQNLASSTMDPCKDIKRKLCEDDSGRLGFYWQFEREIGEVI